MGNSILKFPAPYSPVLTKMSQSTIFFLLWHITKKYWVIACIPSNYHTFHKVLLKLDENWGQQQPFENLNIKILQSAPNDPKLNLKNRTRKVHYICTSYNRGVGLKVSFISLCDQHFQDIADFTVFPLTPMLKFQSAPNDPKLYSNVVAWDMKSNPYKQS